VTMALDSYLDRNGALAIVRDATNCLDLLREFHTSGYLFRGVSNADYRLETTLDRLGAGLKWQKERWLIREFNRRVHHYLPVESIPRTTFELLALMQHYGVPTRLLDFTRSPFVALYFAVRRPARQYDAAVWAFFPNNLQSRTFKRIREQDEELLKAIGKFVNPAQEFTRERLFTKWFMTSVQFASDGSKEIVPHREIVMNLEPFKMNRRLTVQQGLFFVSGSAFRTFEETLTDLLDESQRGLTDGMTEPSVVKIVIPQNLRLPLLKELDLMNINSASLFEGLEGFAASLAERIVTMSGVEMAPSLWSFPFEEGPN